jgi:drug/metabolite transporter (DMT)-like permease
MIQRIQTLWLLLAGTSSLLTLKFPFLAGQKDGIGFSLTSASKFYLLLLAVAVSLAAIASVFLFKNRKLQLKLTGFSFFIGLFLNGLFLYAFLNNSFQLKDAVLTLSAIFYFLIPVFLGLAFIAIRKDEQLIKSMDRLR